MHVARIADRFGQYGELQKRQHIERADSRAGAVLGLPMQRLVVAQTHFDLFCRRVEDGVIRSRVKSQTIRSPRDRAVDLQFPPRNAGFPVDKKPILAGVLPVRFQAAEEPRLLPLRSAIRSEERRVGKEGRSRWSPWASNYG